MSLCCDANGMEAGRGECLLGMRLTVDLCYALTNYWFVLDSKQRYWGWLKIQKKNTITTKSLYFLL